MGLYGRMWLGHFNYGGVTLGDNILGYPAILTRGKIYQAVVNIFSFNIEVMLFEVGTNYRSKIASPEFEDMNDFTKSWDILDRRVLCEKTIPLKILRH